MAASRRHRVIDIVLDEKNNDIGIVNGLVGDALIAGRLVSLACEIAVGGAVYAVVAKLAADRRWASAGALLFAGMAVGFSDWVRPGGLPAVGIPLALIGLLQAVLAPKILKRITRV